MSKKFQVLLRSVFSFAFIVLVLGSYVIVAQTTLTGEWTADAKSEKKPDKIQLNFTRRTEKGGMHQHGSGFDYADLQGLTREQALGSGAVKFSLVREAGTIECEGKFDGTGKGYGTFRFTGNPQFVTAMRSRGFDFETNDAGKKRGDLEERLFAATTIGVTTAFADDLLSANFGKLTVDDLFKAAIFKITPQFMSEMKTSGFPNLGMEELVKARIFKIDADFVRQVAQMGFEKEPFEALVKMRIFKVTPEFITEVRNEGLSNLDVEDLVKMRIFKIDGAFIRQAKADGVPLEVEKLVQKRIGVYGRDE
jgi:hypothetical protein